MNKDKIIKALEHVFYSNAKQNIVSEGRVKSVYVKDENRISISLILPNPSLHAKKKITVDILKAVHLFVDTKAKVDVQVEIEKKEAAPTIRGTEIKGVRNIIAIASGKGGVGKSTLTSNLAITLSKMGFAVGLLDADIYGPSIPTMFDIEQQKPQSKQVKEGSLLMLPIEAYGVKVMSLGFFAGSNQAVVWRGAMATKAIKQLIRNTHWGTLDFLLVDLPPGTGDIHLSIVQEIPLTGAVIVSTPQKVALADVKKGIAMFEMPAINVPILGLVENMAYFTPEELPHNKYYLFGEGGARRVAESTGIHFLGEVPIVQSIRISSDVGRPASLQENTPVSKNYKEIGQQVVKQLIKRNKELPPTEIVRITTMAGCNR